MRLAPLQSVPKLRIDASSQQHRTIFQRDGRQKSHQVVSPAADAELDSNLKLL